MSDIGTFFKSVWAVLTNPNLTWLWWCVAGYVVCWGLAWFIASLGGRTGTTIVFRCRQGWLIAFVLHVLASVAVTATWAVTNGNFRGFVGFLSAYLVMCLVDVAIIMKLLSGMRAYRTFGR